MKYHGFIKSCDGEIAIVMSQQTMKLSDILKDISMPFNADYNTISTDSVSDESPTHVIVYKSYVDQNMLDELVKKYSNSRILMQQCVNTEELHLDNRLIGSSTPNITDINLSDLKVGDMVAVDEGYECMTPWSMHKVQVDDDGLFIHCNEGHHYLEGQKTNGSNDLLVGVYKLHI